MNCIPKPGLYPPKCLKPGFYPPKPLVLPKTLVTSILGSLFSKYPMVQIARLIVTSTDIIRTINHISIISSTPYYLSCKGHSIKGLYTP
jgi:hypothetical protein